MPPSPPLPTQIDALLRAALEEDLGAGDLTTRSVLGEADPAAVGRIRAKEAFVVAGLPVARRVFELLDPEVGVEQLVAEGEVVEAGDTLAEIRGGASMLLIGERTALNIMGRLCGIATLTRRYREAMGDSPALLLSTRKTTPGLRALEVYALEVGGGVRHRTGLDAGVLIKTNHVRFAGSVSRAIENARARLGPNVSIEIEVCDLEELEAAVATGADVALLDNFDVEGLREAVQKSGGRILLEASGGVNLENVGEIAATGVDAVSVGRLTHSATAVDLHMVVEPVS
jgi:nicotinate-nucleotide pyrophosphorylase (carboxylating)